MAREVSRKPASRKGTAGKAAKPVKVNGIVRNPNAPKPSTPSTGLVKPITKSETKMKKDKARRDRSGIGRPQNANAFKKTDAQGKPVKASTGNKKIIENTQVLNKKGYIPLTPGEKAAANEKKSKTRGRGGMGGGGLFGGGAIRKSK
jgi:hypothetical protein